MAILRGPAHQISAENTALQARVENLVVNLLDLWACSTVFTSGQQGHSEQDAARQEDRQEVAVLGSKAAD